MPRGRATIEEAYADIPIPGAQQVALAAHARSQEATQSMNTLMASIRGDMAGAPINGLVHPRTYQQRVLRIWEFYNLDPFFQRMINRTVEFAANGSRFEVVGDLEDESWLKKVDDNKEILKLEREERFWNSWGERINEGVFGVTQGIDEVSSWLVKHMMLSGMATVAWELGEMKFGKMNLVVPTRMTVYPASAISIYRDRDMFASERLFYRMQPGDKSIPVQEGEPAEAHPGVFQRNKYDIELPRISEFSRKGSTEAFVLRYNWSPGDLTTIRLGQQVFTGANVYPILPFLGLLPIFVTRQKLFAADLAILDGIINFIMAWKIGDKDNPPKGPVIVNGKVMKEGTVAQVRRLIQEGRIGPAMELFLPYYVDLDIKTPDSGTLLSETKYVQSTIEIFQAFGIFFSRSASGSRERMERINITNFEEILGSIRRHLVSFWRMMTAHIVRLNPGKFSETPLWMLNPLNTKNDVFIGQLQALAKIGRISARTLLRYHGLDELAEARRIAFEQGLDMDDLFDANVPISFVQQVGEQPDWGGDHRTRPKPTKETTAISPTRQQGRPPNTGAPPGQRQDRKVGNKLPRTARAGRKRNNKQS